MAVEFKKLAFEDDVVTKSLLTTKGDIIYASAAGTPARLGIGADNDILKVDTDVPAWEADTGSSWGNLDNGFSDSTFGGVSPIDCGSSI